MKKTTSVLCLLLALSMLLSPLCCAAGDNYDTLADWDIRIAVPDGATAVLKGGEYYLYAQKAGYIPYVMLRPYKYESEQKFLEDFTEYMGGQHADLSVTRPPEKLAVGDKLCWETDYSYKISGVEVVDRRIAVKHGERVYMFASKEVPSRGMTVGTMLEDVVAECEFLTEDESGVEKLEEEYSLAPAYLYCLDNGMPKYWLDFSGAMADDPVLHCSFRSGEPSFSESVFILKLDTAKSNGGRIDFTDVMDRSGRDVTEWFKRLSIRFEDGELVLDVKRNESTLAGGEEDNILTGVYRMSPVGVCGEYRYYLENGMLKYWLDMSGGKIELHAMFRSGSPEYYEELFTLEAESADGHEYGVRINKVFNSKGLEVSDWFRSLTLTQVEGAVVMNVRRDERTLAGGEEDNILTGVYLFEPWTCLAPEGDGPFTAAELGRWAQIRYFRQTGVYPQVVKTARKGTGYSIRLFETAKQSEALALYTVDRYGVGTDGLTGLPVRLCG